MDTTKIPPTAETSEPWMAAPIDMAGWPKDVVDVLKATSTKFAAEAHKKLDVYKSVSESCENQQELDVPIQLLGDLEENIRNDVVVAIGKLKRGEEKDEDPDHSTAKRRRKEGDEAAAIIIEKARRDNFVAGYVDRYFMASSPTGDAKCDAVLSTGFDAYAGVFNKEGSRGYPGHQAVCDVMVRFLEKQCETKSYATWCKDLWDTKKMLDAAE